MSDDEMPNADIIGDAVNEIGNLVTLLAAFTAQCEINGYSRAEAVRLTAGYMQTILGAGGSA